MTLDSHVLVCLTQRGASLWYLEAKRNWYQPEIRHGFGNIPMPDEGGFLRCTLRQLMLVLGGRIRDGMIVNNEIVLLE